MLESLVFPHVIVFEGIDRGQNEAIPLRQLPGYSGGSAIGQARQRPANALVMTFSSGDRGARINASPKHMDADQHGLLP
ncbi:hypothetical protein DYI23_05375 [Roseibium polysiphoniae]|uniref:Uncharacterized protein n=1 Tax=Roseibium polysiphoniae TaxID=2571221 RepID=A0A944GRY3_9HYPH|nr:hypothetical protein [Roseibium polysiphoniae]